MNITFDELRRIKHALPHGSIARIALDLGIEEQTVRNYFGAHHYEDGAVVDFHLEPDYSGTCPGYSCRAQGIGLRACTPLYYKQQ